jgi:hypothetical protein
VKNGSQKGAAEHVKYTPLLILSALTFVSAAAANAAAANKMVGKPCLAKYKSIKATGKHWTAFAANQANAAGQACGWAIQFDLKGIAVYGALRECRASEHDHPTWGTRGTCEIIFVQ